MNKKIPITIGVTGHRAIAPEKYEIIKSKLKEELKNLMQKYSSSEFVMLNSLASGGDSLCASVAIELGINIVAVLPFEKEEYAKDFNEEELKAFNNFLEYAKKVIVIDKTQTRDEGYRNAGLYVANQSHILVALWDGEGGNDEGCGTADVVYYLTNYKKEYSIIHITTPRKTSYADFEVKKLEVYENYTDKMLAITNDFNGECSEDIFDSADKLSLVYQQKYIRSLKYLAFIGVLMVLAFLLYDEIDLKLCLPIYTVLLAIGALLLRKGKKAKYHEKYLTYRMLAESLRVQKVIDNLNKKYNVAEFYPWTCYEDTSWIRKAIDALKLTNPNKLASDVRQEWIEEELAYHVRSQKKVEETVRGQNSVSNICKIATVFIIFFFTIIELCSPDVMNRMVLGLNLKLWCCILVGVLSACALFLSSFFDRLALNRKIKDHSSMINLYNDALKQIKQKGFSEELVLFVAKEEIIENGNWYSYMKENSLDINI